jgi:hypothetical protein
MTEPVTPEPDDGPTQPLVDVKRFQRRKAGLREYAIAFVLATLLSVGVMYGLAWIATLVLNARR